MFENTTELIYLGMRTGVSKSGQPYNVLVIGNPAKYENYEFFVPDSLQLPPLQVNDKVIVSVEMSKRGYNLVPSLVDITKVVAK